MTRRETRCSQPQHCGGHRPRSRAKATFVGIISAALVLISAAALAAAPTLVSVVVRGSTVYDAPSFFAVYGEELGKPVSADGARAIATTFVAK